MQTSKSLPTYIGRTLFRADDRPFGIKQADRLSHLYIIGKTGTGKSTLLEAMAFQDLRCARGFALIDPHGDLAARIYARVPPEHRANVTYLDAADPAQLFGYNPLRQVRKDRIALAASGFLEVLKKSWAAAWGVRMEHILRNALFALLERPNSTISDISRLLGDRQFRRDIATTLTNEPVRRFWEKEYDGYSQGYRVDGAASIQNKIGAFLADPVLRRILTTPDKDISIRRVMDEGKVLLVNLSKGRMGADSASLLGGFLMTTIGLAGFSRADTPEQTRRPFHLFADEFQDFTTLAVANMLSELRKYGVGITIAHQYMHQLSPEIRHAIVGNAGSMIAFRVGAEDALFLAREFQDRFDPIDLLNLKNHHIYLKLLIDGEPSKPFSAVTLSP